ncbi:hypothetical protein DPMN_178633, partial [Dreissena polymorpha]
KNMDDSDMNLLYLCSSGNYKQADAVVRADAPSLAFVVCLFVLQLSTQAVTGYGS